MARAKAMMAQGARSKVSAPRKRIRLWEMDGMCTKVDSRDQHVFLINASGGEPTSRLPTAARSSRCRRSSRPPERRPLQTLKPGEANRHRVQRADPAQGPRFIASDCKPSRRLRDCAVLEAARRRYRARLVMVTAIRSVGATKGPGKAGFRALLQLLLMAPKKEEAGGGQANRREQQ